IRLVEPGNSQEPSNTVVEASVRHLSPQLIGADGTWFANFGVSIVLSRRRFLRGVPVMRTSRAFWSVCPLAVFTVAIVFGSLVSQAPAQVGQRLRHMGQPMHQGVSTGRADQADTGTKARKLLGMKVCFLICFGKSGPFGLLEISQDGRVK